MQQDNCHIHNAEDTLDAFDLMGIDVMDWPPYSPDLNPIENLWSVMKRRLSGKLYSSRE